MTFAECQAAVGSQVTYNGPARPGPTSVTILAAASRPMEFVSVRDSSGSVFKAKPSELTA